MTLQAEFNELLAYNRQEPVRHTSPADGILGLIEIANAQNDPRSQNAQATLQALEELVASHDAADQYAALLRGEEIQPGTRSGFLHDGTSRFGVSLEKVHDALQKMSIDIPFEMHFDTYPTGDFNAVAIGARTGILCLLNLGVPRLISSVAHVFAYLVLGSFPEEEQDVLFAASVMRAVLGYLNGAEHSFLVYPHIEISPRHVQIRESLLNVMQSFIVAHEVGHAVLGHTSPDPEWSPSDIGPMVHSNDSEGSLHEWEYDADAFAQRVLNTIGPPFAHGGLCVLYFILCINVLSAKRDGLSHSPNDESVSHPATLQRIERLRNLVEDESECGTGEALVGVFVQLYDVLQQVEMHHTDQGLLVKGLGRSVLLASEGNPPA